MTQTTRSTIAATTLLLAAALLLSACATAAPFNRPVCNENYKSCTDTCAPLCEESGINATDLSDNEWKSDCADCAERCKEAGERCDDSGSATTP